MAYDLIEWPFQLKSVYAVDFKRKVYQLKAQNQLMQWRQIQPGENH